MDSTNTSYGVDMNNQVPLSFTSRKFSGFDEFVIPNDLYNKVRFGRDRNSRWNSFIDQPELCDAVKTSLYKDGRCYATCELTGASVCLKHEKRSKTTNESLNIVPSFHLVESEEDFSENEDYIDAYFHALENLALSEDQSDFFAQCILSFLDDYNSFYSEQNAEDLSDILDSVIDIQSTLQYSIDEVRCVSEENSLDPHYELDIFSRLFEYLTHNYEL